MLEALFILILLEGTGTVRGIVIPPKWANVTLNPCSKKSWQLLHWPEDNKCYPIFTKGPCGETEVISFDAATGRAKCHCSRGSLWDPESKRCHEEYTKGPCNHRHYFRLKPPKQKEDQEGQCVRYDVCPAGHVFWPRTKECFPYLSRGPCLHGNLVNTNPETGSTECSCDSSLMSSNYWPHGDSCHELFTRGPCMKGHIFLYNPSREQTECVCGLHLTIHYHPATGRCYELNTTGPCKGGQVFVFDSTTNSAKCSCLEGYIKWPANGHCHRAYTQGPCGHNHIFRPSSQIDEGGTCHINKCKNGALYDPKSDACYQAGRRGPCPRGKLWVFERASSIKGACSCDAELIGFWPPHGICYELGERGPCPKMQVLTYERGSKKIKCRCDVHRGFITWTNGKCVKSGVGSLKEPPGDAKRVSTRTTDNAILYPDNAILYPWSQNASLSFPSVFPTKSWKSKRVHQLPKELQEDILADILHTINNISSAKTSNSVGAEISVVQEPNDRTNNSGHEINAGFVASDGDGQLRQQLTRRLDIIQRRLRGTRTPKSVSRTSERSWPDAWRSPATSFVLTPPGYAFPRFKRRKDLGRSRK